MFESTLHNVDPTIRTLVTDPLAKPSGNALASISTSSVGRSDTYSLEFWVLGTKLFERLVLTF